MIAYIEGEISHLDPAHAIIQAGGVGYEIRISLQTFDEVRQLGTKTVRLLTHLQISEQAHTLFGFASKDEKILFMNLISVSGIGPSSAIIILSSSNANDIIQAIVEGKVATLQRIKGIGPKSAQRIVLELSDKLKKNFNPSLTNSSFGTNTTAREEALSALVVLGLARQAAEKTIDTILKNSTRALSTEEIIRMALQS
jgi:holliday junction DNA helicase RuvA